MIAHPWAEIDRAREDAEKVRKLIADAKGWTLIEPVAEFYRARKRFKGAADYVTARGRNASEQPASISEFEDRHTRAGQRGDADLEALAVLGALFLLALTVLGVVGLCTADGMDECRRMCGDNGARSFVARIRNPSNVPDVPERCECFEKGGAR